MTRIGVNVDPLSPAGAPDPAAIRAAGANAVRFVSRKGAEGYPEACRAAGLFVLGVLAQESDGYVVPGLDALQIGNEPDGQPPSSWIMSPDEYVALWQSVAPRDGLPRLAAGLCAGDLRAGYWRAVAPQLEGCAGVALHIYGSPANLTQRLILAHQTASPNLPVWVTEWHADPPQIDDLQVLFDALTAGAFWFCWSDAMVPGYGLIDHPDTRAAWQAATQEASTMATLDELDARVQQLEQQQALQTRALRQILEGKLDGADGAAGTVVALEGGQTTVTVALGK